MLLKRGRPSPLQRAGMSRRDIGPSGVSVALESRCNSDVPPDAAQSTLTPESLSPGKTRHAGRTRDLTVIRPASPPSRRSAYRARQRDTAYMLWVKTLPCLMAGVWGTCQGTVEADHAGLRGMGRKAPDNTTIPLCHYHHHSGRFPRGWDKPLRRAWLDAAVGYVQALARLMVGTPIARAVPDDGVSVTDAKSALMRCDGVMR